MQNNYEQYFFLVYSLARTCTRYSFDSYTTGGGLLRKGQIIVSKWGSINCITPKSRPLKLNIFVDRARRTVKTETFCLGFLTAKLKKTAISVKITFWEGEQFP